MVTWPNIQRFQAPVHLSRKFVLLKSSIDFHFHLTLPPRTAIKLQHPTPDESTWRAGGWFIVSQFGPVGSSHILTSLTALSANVQRDCELLGRHMLAVTTKLGALERKENMGDVFQFIREAQVSSPGLGDDFILGLGFLLECMATVNVSASLEVD